MSSQESLTEGQPNQEPDHQHDDPTAESTLVATYAEVSIGPLPPPHALREYEEIIPGAADRILTMAERQSEHRMHIENNDSRRSYLGLAAGFLLSLAIIGAAIYLIVRGEAWVAVSLIGINVAALAGVFVYGSRTLRNHQVSNGEATDSYT